MSRAYMLFVKAETISLGEGAAFFTLLIKQHKGKDAEIQKQCGIFDKDLLNREW